VSEHLEGYKKQDSCPRHFRPSSATVAKKSFGVDQQTLTRATAERQLNENRHVARLLTLKANGRRSLIRPSFPAAGSNAWPSPAAWQRGRPSCCSTSRSATLSEPLRTSGNHVGSGVLAVRPEDARQSDAFPDNKLQGIVQSSAFQGRCWRLILAVGPHRVKLDWPQRLPTGTPFTFSLSPERSVELAA
jgi:hypothetical protein